MTVRQNPFKMKLHKRTSHWFGSMNHWTWTIGFNWCCPWIIWPVVGWTNKKILFQFSQHSISVSPEAHFSLKQCQWEHCPVVHCVLVVFMGTQGTFPICAWSGTSVGIIWVTEKCKCESFIFEDHLMCDCLNDHLNWIDEQKSVHTKDNEHKTSTTADEIAVKSVKHQKACLSNTCLLTSVCTWAALTQALFQNFTEDTSTLQQQSEIVKVTSNWRKLIKCDKHWYS